MGKGKHSEAQIIAALKQVEAGRKVEDVARECGVSKHTIYAWKSKYGGMDVSEAQEVKQLREENARLKKLVADLSLDKDMSLSESAASISSRIRSSLSGSPALSPYNRLITILRSARISERITSASGLGAGPATASSSA